MAQKKNINKWNNRTAEASSVAATPKEGGKDNSGKGFFEKIGINAMPWVCMGVFIVLAWVMLVGKNSDYLFMVQEKSLFSSTDVFFDERMKVPQGLLQWIGCYLTQFFYHPMVGSGMLIALWCITFYAIKRTFGISNRWSAVILIPLVALLCSEIDLGYWLYYIKKPGYWFTESLGLLITVLAVWLGKIIPTRRWWIKMIWMLLWTIFGYMFFGWFALFGTLLMVLTDIKRDGLTMIGRIAIPVTAIAAIAVVPLMFYQKYTSIRFEDIYLAGFPFFMTDKAYSFWPSVPFAVMAISLICFALHPLFTKGKSGANEKKANLFGTIAAAVILAGSILTTWHVNFDNYNYHAEMRMYRATAEFRWNDVLSEMANLPGPPNRQMVMLKNIALMNTGEMGYKMFHYPNTGELPYIYDSLDVHMVQTGAPLIYYNYGKTNFAYRWCMENSVEYGFNVDNLKLMSLASIVSGEHKLATKYLDILKTTTFHKKWVDKHERLIEDKTDLTKVPEFDKIMQLRHFSNILDGDQGLCEMYIINYFSNTMNKDNKLLQEVTLLYSLIQKDIQQFWPRFFLYATLHEKEQMPIHYQEAAYLYGNLEKEVDITKMPFDQQLVVNRYNQFNQMTQAYLKQGMSTDQIAEATKSMFGDTFWWFYFFCRDVKSY